MFDTTDLPRERVAAANTRPPDTYGPVMVLEHDIAGGLCRTRRNDTDPFGVRRYGGYVK